MADDQKRRPASPAGWKGAAAPGHKKGPAYGWKPQGSDAPVGQRGRRVRQLLILLGGITCAVLIVVVIKLLQQPPRAGLALVGADPAADVDRLDAPLDVYGWLGGKRLAQWATSAAEKNKPV